MQKIGKFSQMSKKCFILPQLLYSENTKKRKISAFFLMRQTAFSASQQQFRSNFQNYLMNNGILPTQSNTI